MTERLNPLEFVKKDTYVPEPRLSDYAKRVLPERIRELEELAKHLPTLPELTDLDEALRALRHLRKQLEND